MYQAAGHKRAPTAQEFQVIFTLNKKCDLRDYDRCMVDVAISDTVDLQGFSHITPQQFRHSEETKQNKKNIQWVSLLQVEMPC